MHRSTGFSGGTTPSPSLSFAKGRSYARDAHTSLAFSVRESQSPRVPMTASSRSRAERPCDRLYRPKFQFNKRGRWNSTPRFMKGDNPTSTMIFPSTRQIFPCSAPSFTGVDPYQVTGVMGAPTGWRDPTNRLAIDNLQRPGVRYEDPSIDKYGVNQKFVSPSYSDSSWKNHTRSLSFSGINDHRPLNKNVVTSDLFPTGRQTRTTVFAPSSPRGTGSPRASLSAYTREAPSTIS